LAGVDCSPVTPAIRLLDELRRAHPERSLKEIWRQIYRERYLEYTTLPLIERRSEEDQLHRQVCWRLYARRRRRRQKTGKTVMLLFVFWICAPAPNR
jgi:hypothetical protein